MTDPAAKSLGRRGGLAKSEKKAQANAAKSRQFWAEVRAGIRPKPISGRPKKTG